MALALCLTLLPTAALAADGTQAADGTGHTHTGATKLWVDGGMLKKDDGEWKAEPIEVWGSEKKTVYQLPEGTYYLDSNIEITEYPIMITGNVTLCLNGKQITCGSSAPDCVIGVYANADSELTLTDCGSTGEIKGGKIYGVKVYKGYKLNMHGGTITGGVEVNGSEGKTTKFNMSGGTITGGGVGVTLTEYCEFTMSGGTISGNKGGVLTGSGTFTMTGGEISGNTATSNGGGVNIGNGGKFEMSGTAQITRNTAAYAGGGVYVSGGTFIMNGGEIKSNTANTAGGGVFVQNGTFTVSGEPIVSENTSGREGNKVTDNVCLDANKTITIGSGLTEGTNIGVTTGSAKVPTEDSTVPIATATSNANGYLNYFKSDNDSYEIKANDAQTQLELKAKPKTKLTSSNTTITITNDDGFVYSGTEITPTVTVTYDGGTDGSTTLKPGRDYTVTGSSGTDAKDYTLKITGTGQYTGSVEKKWTITPLTVIVSSVTLRDKEYDGTRNGSSSDVASVTVKKGSSDSDSVTLKSEDYKIESVTYADANAGIRNADIIIKLAENGNYTFAGNQLTAQAGTQGKITQASVNNLKAQTGEINVVNNKADTYTLNLNKLLPTLPDGCKYGEITYRPVSKTFTLGNYNGAGMKISDDGTLLILPIAAANDKKVNETICTGQVTAKTQNYKDITLTINVIASDAPKENPVYTAPTAKTLTYNGQEQELINAGTVTGGTMMYRLDTTGEYSMAIPKAKDVGEYTVYFKVVGDETHNNIENESTMKVTAKINAQELAPVASITLNKTSASLKVGGSVTLTATVSPTDATSKSVTWTSSKPEVATVANDGTVTAHKAGTAEITATAEDDSEVSATCKVTVTDDTTTGGGTTPSQPGGSTGGNTGGSSSSSSGSYDSNPIIKTETKNNPDGSTTKTETRKDGSVTQTTTAKDGSTSKTETKKDGSSVTENKAADGSTGTVKTDKNGQTTAETTLSSKAIEDAKKSGEPVKAPVEVKAARNSGAAPTVKVELPQNAGKTEVEIPVSNANAGTVAVLVRPDGTEEILKDSIPTEDGIRLTVDGSATVKIVDNAKDFIDTQNHWAKDEIDFVSARELVNGISATRYAPDATATRAQLWTILARQNDTDLSGGANWYEKAQLWSKDKGISDGTNPNATITRAQMVTMLWRTMGQPAATDKVSFADVPADSYYAQAVAWAVEGGITQGVGGDRFDPNATCTRAQIAAFLARSMK